MVCISMHEYLLAPSKVWTVPQPISQPFEELSGWNSELKLFTTTYIISVLCKFVAPYWGVTWSVVCYYRYVWVWKGRYKYVWAFISPPQVGFERGRGRLTSPLSPPQSCVTGFIIYFLNPIPGLHYWHIYVIGDDPQSGWTDPDTPVISLPWPVIMYHIILYIWVQVLLYWIVSIISNPPKST